MTIHGEYYKLRHKAMVLKDDGDYDLGSGEMNPAIFEEFIGLLFDSDLLPVVWEPFAANPRTLEIADESEIELLAQSLEPKHPRILQADSTKQGPGKKIGGVLFHPPYLGTAPLSSHKDDMSLLVTLNRYTNALQKVVSFVNMRLVSGGLVCAVGRDYRYQGISISIPGVYLDLFCERGYSLEAVWSSEPDVITIFRRI